MSVTKESLLEQSQLGIAVIDEEYNILLANEAFTRMLALGRIPHSLEKALTRVLPEEKTAIIQLVQDCIMGKSIPMMEVHTNDGATSLEVLMNCISYGSQRAVEMVVHDITDRRKREESLAKSEKRFKDLIELAPDGIVTLNLKGVITYCNAATVQLTGYPKDEIVGKHISNLGFVRARDIPRFLKLFTTIVKGKIPDVIEIVWNHKDGTPHSAEIRVQFLKEDSKPTELLVVTRDTTKAKKAEENLRESEQRYRSIVELAPDGIVTADLKGFITSCNTAFFQLSGFSEDEIIGKHFTQLPTLRAKDMPAYMKLFASLISGKRTKPVEFVWVHKDGTLRLGEVKASVLKKGRRVTGLQTVLRDITERKQAEEA